MAALVRVTVGANPATAGMIPACPSDDQARWKRTHNFVEREPITSALTVGRELGKRRFAQRFPVVPW
jgi:hypothetical protein